MGTKKLPVEEIVCAGCDVVFIQNRRNQKYHDKNCGMADWQRKHRKVEAKTTT